MKVVEKSHYKYDEAHHSRVANEWACGMHIPDIYIYIYTKCTAQVARTMDTRGERARGKVICVLPIICAAGRERDRDMMDKYDTLE